MLPSSFVLLVQMVPAMNVCVYQEKSSKTDQFSQSYKRIFVRGQEPGASKPGRAAGISHAPCEAHIKHLRMLFNYCLPCAPLIDLAGEVACEIFSVTYTPYVTHVSPRY